MCLEDFCQKIKFSRRRWPRYYGSAHYYSLFQGAVKNIMWKEAEAKLQQSNRRETFETI